MTLKVFIDNKPYSPVLHSSKEYSGPYVVINDQIYEPSPLIRPRPQQRWTTALHDLEYDYPTGAWGMTSDHGQRQVGILGGVNASIRAAEAHRPTASWISTLTRVATELNLPLSVLVAISSRESYHGRLLDKNGEGDRGNGFGVMQVDKRHHSQAGRPDPYSYAHALQAGHIFLSYLQQVAIKHPEWPDKYVLKGATVAYNSGLRNVATINGMDRGTTGDDYGADTLCRAKHYVKIYGW